MFFIKLERLTVYGYEINGETHYESLNFPRDKKGQKQAFINALGAYEDTGLTPSAINELKSKQLIVKNPIKTEAFMQACPVCKHEANGQYCSNCGQRLK